MRHHGITLVIAGAILAAGCDSPATTESREASLAAASSKSAHGIVASATGDGHAELPTGFGIMSFAFGVNQHVSGRALGEFRQTRSRNGLLVDFVGVATCVTVDAEHHRAWIGGVVTENNSTDPNFQTAIHQVGRDIWFRVVDNGEGNDAAADRSTVFGFTGAGGFTTSAQYCAGQPWAAGDANTFPVVDGNIQVRE